VIDARSGLVASLAVVGEEDDMQRKSSYLRHRVVGSVLVGLAAALLTFPAVSGANVRFVGETSQHRGVKVAVGDDGLVRRVSIGWRADCRRPHTRDIERTVVTPPLHRSTERYFAGRGHYDRRQGPYRLRIRVGITGKHPSLNRWKGVFRATVRVRRHGQAFDRCHTGKIRWAAIHH
jgi:hypothetical protein